MDVVTAEDEGVAAKAFAIPYAKDGGGRFMSGHLITKLVGRQRLAQRWPHLTVAVLDGDQCVARGVSIPFSSTVEGREPFPDGGWEQVVIWASEDALDERPPDTVCALEIAVHPDWQRRGLSRLALDGLRANTTRQGFTRFVAPVRPPLKATEPWVSMDDYMARTRADGLPADPWLRVHVRAGGKLRSVARRSATITADLDQWRRWTGLPLRDDGPVAVEGGLAPILISNRLDLGCYVEPNVWIDHSR